MLFLNASIFLLTLCLLQCLSHLISKAVHITFHHLSNLVLLKFQVQNRCQHFCLFIEFYAEHIGGHLNLSDTIFKKGLALMSAIILSLSYFHLLEDALLPTLTTWSGYRNSNSFLVSLVRSVRVLKVPINVIPSPYPLIIWVSNSKTLFKSLVISCVPDV